MESVKKSERKRPEFIDHNGTFRLEKADMCNNLYFPAASDCGLKSSLTPNLSGDAKTDQNHFLLEPVSIEDLNKNRLTRNFWCVLDGKNIWSASGNSAYQNAVKGTSDGDEVNITAGFMWQTVTRTNKKLGIASEITSFVPYDKNVEIHIVRITNLNKERELIFVPAIPIYGRSADNIRDHRHVTSLLSRVEVTKNGVIDRPTFSFDERGHKPGDSVYFASFTDESGNLPETFYPVLDDFVGDLTPDMPQTVVKLAKSANPESANSAGSEAEGFKPGDKVNGQEVTGACSFKPITLLENGSHTYMAVVGIAGSDEEYERLIKETSSLTAALESLRNTKSYWISKVNIGITTADPYFDNFMRWVAFQPVLRRIYGCSFLPHHDYGKGGRGWRDLWQDCLALLMMDPSGVKQMLLGNFAGTRTDGTNATIIGSRPGEFKADRNMITRVWMDHGVWPLITTALYIDETGDTDILSEECAYFCDKQILRGRKMSERPESAGTLQLDEAGAVYKGTVLEHLLIQNLTAFWEVGEHNILLLRDADWNDALDMAPDRGESVAFSCAYAGNLVTLADLIDKTFKPSDNLYLLKPVETLLSDAPGIYEDPAFKKEVLDKYLKAVAGDVPAARIPVTASELARNLRRKAKWLKSHIAANEWISDGNLGWFNGYYDNNGRKLDLSVPDVKNMTLTGQVFAIMCGVAGNEEIKKITKSADRKLYDETSGGYRLNTDFGVVKTDMGRMFGFAYGEKENGAVFSHMAVMYANALYKRGFKKEGYKALKALYDASADFERSKIYPGIPEYFGRGGRGLYGYLTGAASWYLMTVVMQMFGVRGEYGNLIIDPALLKEQFTAGNTASVELEFLGKPLLIKIYNAHGLECDEYRVTDHRIDGSKSGGDIKNGVLIIGKTAIDLMDPNVRHLIEVFLGR